LYLIFSLCFGLHKLLSNRPWSGCQPSAGSSSPSLRLSRQAMLVVPAPKTSGLFHGWWSCSTGEV